MRLKLSGPGVDSGSVIYSIIKAGDQAVISYDFECNIGKRIFGKFIGKSFHKRDRVSVAANMLLEATVSSYTTIILGGLILKREGATKVFTFNQGDVSGTVVFRFDGMDFVDIEEIIFTYKPIGIRIKAT